MPLIVFGGIGLLLSGGYFADKVGEGLNDTGSGALKITLAIVAGYYVAKKTGVLK